MGHYISAFCPTHGDVDCDDGNAFCEDCYEVTPKGALTAAQDRIEKLERMVVWGVEKDCRLVNRHVWQIDAGYIECDGTHASILAAVEKAMDKP